MTERASLVADAIVTIAAMPADAAITHALATVAAGRTSGLRKVGDV